MSEKTKRSLGLDSHTFTDGFVLAILLFNAHDDLPESWHALRGALVLVAWFLLLRILWVRIPK